MTLARKLPGSWYTCVTVLELPNGVPSPKSQRYVYGDVPEPSRIVASSLTVSGVSPSSSSDDARTFTPRWVVSFAAEREAVAFDPSWATGAEAAGLGFEAGSSRLHPMG